MLQPLAALVNSRSEDNTNTHTHTLLTLTHRLKPCRSQRGSPPCPRSARSLGLVVVAQVRAHPLLDLLDRHALALGVVGHLVLAELARLEVGRARVAEDEAVGELGAGRMPVYLVLSRSSHESFSSGPM